LEKIKKQNSESQNNKSDPSDEVIRRKILILLIISIIIIATSLGYLLFNIGPVFNSKRTNELNDDWDSENRTFKSFKQGDSLDLFGRIIDVIETKYFEDNRTNRTQDILTEKYGGKYIYVIDKNFKIYSNEDLGNSGDYVIVKCKVAELEEEVEIKHILQVKSNSNLMPHIYISLIVLIAGVLLLIIAFRKRKKYVQESSKLHKLSKIYTTMGSKDEEEELYRFMHLSTKEKAVRSEEFEEKRLHEKNQIKYSPKTPITKGGVRSGRKVVKTKPEDTKKQSTKSKIKSPRSVRTRKD